MTGGVLVAGIGNIFFRDDGFGPAVATALLAGAAERPLPDGVRVVDYGIRGMHLSFDLLGGVDALVIVDAVPPGAVGMPAAAPGTVATLEIGPHDLGEGQFDAHGMSPVAVLASLRPMGAELPPTYLVGCVPADLSEGIGLTELVAERVSAGVAAVFDVLTMLDTERSAFSRSRVES